MSLPLRVAVTYRVCQHWRAGVFGLLAAHPDVDLLVLHGESVPGTKLLNGSNLDGFPHVELRSWNLRMRSTGREAFLTFNPGMYGALRRFRPDVIVAEGGSNIATNILVYLYAILHGTPVVWWTLGQLLNRRYESLVSRMYRSIVVFMERRSAALLGYSSVALDYFRSMGYPEERMFRAVNVVDTTSVLSRLPEDAAKASELRQAMKLEDKIVVLFVGALVATKRIHRLLNAFARVAPNAPNAELVIVGDGSDRKRLEALAEQSGIAGQTRFVGEVIDDVGVYYELGDIFVLPGLGGLAISEAMAHSLPVICGVGDGCEVDLVRPGETGFRFAEGDDERVEDQIAEYLRRLMANPAERKQIGANARAVIDNEYNAQSYVDSILDSVRYAHQSTRRSA